MDPSTGPTPDAPDLRWALQPDLVGSVLIVAFEGWNDAGDAATSAVSMLHDEWDATIVADIDPETYYDFTTTRPRVELDDDGERRIVWPANELSIARGPTGAKPVALFRGVEPQLRWRTFCQHVVRAAQALDVELVVTLGALLAEVPHSRPVSVFGTAYADSVIEDLGMSPSRYEGPTGIVGVLHAACRDAGLESASLWAAVPTYVPGAPSPKAAQALVQRVALLLDTEVDTTALDIASASYERQVSELVAEDEETAEYVTALEQRYDDDTVGDMDSLVEQVERFLREQRD
jgi:proteasome assembly chaperone (PAC2) family protein